MTVRTRNRLITFSILAGPFIFLFCLLLFWDAEPLPPVPPLPNPNGYDDLVKAGETITGDVGNYRQHGARRNFALRHKAIQMPLNWPAPGCKKSA